MYTKFHDKTLITQFIQQLLADSAFPIEKTIYYGDYVVSGVTYIVETFIVKAIKSGKLTENNFSDLLQIIGPYVYGNNYPGLTCNFISANSAYDSITHYYLGQYLRAYRDLKQINLLPFYNCFGDEYLNQISFTEASGSRPASVVNYPDNRYKFVSIPIKFGKEYSISIDFFGSIEMRCAFIGKKGLLQNDTDDLTSIFPNISLTKVYGQMPHPYLFQGVKLDSVLEHITPANEALLAKLLTKEKYLRLILRIPISCNSSIVVLEGNYTKTNNLCISNSNLIPYRVIFGNLSSANLSGEELVRFNNLLISQLSLIKMSDGYSYPFADRLIEYLLQSVITSQDSIDNNIKKVQELVSSYTQQRVNNTQYTSKYVPGVWDINLQNYLYNVAIQSPDIKSKYDLTGFVDKDVEQLITRGV